MCFGALALFGQLFIFFLCVFLVVFGVFLWFLVEKWGERNPESALSVGGGGWKINYASSRTANHKWFLKAVF